MIPAVLTNIKRQKISSCMLTHSVQSDFEFFFEMWEKFMDSDFMYNLNVGKETSRVWHFTSSRGHWWESYITFMRTHLSPDCCAVSCLAGYIYLLSVPEKYEM